jgi:hypothetical protein
MTAVDTLKTLGFKEQKTTEFQTLSDDLGLSENYPHKVLAVLTKDGVTALIEQNVSEDEAGGVVSITKHPAVLIMESSKGRVCIPNHDDADNAALITEVAGDLA